MVRPSLFSTDGERDRAQLILVGSIAIALVIIGLVVVINTVLFTENVATSESADRAGDAAKFDFQVRRDARSLILRLNHEQRQVDGPTLSGRITENVTRFGRVLRESRATRNGVWIDIGYDNASSKWGQRVVKGEDGPLTAPDGNESWDVLGDNEGTLGRFILNVNVSETSQTEYSINVSNATEYVNISIRSVDSGANANVSVDTTVPSGDYDSECNPSSGVVLLDIEAGEAFTGPCTFNGTGHLTAPLNVTVRNGDNGHGQFGLVMNESVENYRADPFSPSGGTPKTYDACTASPDETCTTPALWTANVTYRYESRTIDFTQNRNLSIYP